MGMTIFREKPSWEADRFRKDSWKRMELSKYSDR